MNSKPDEIAFRLIEQFVTLPFDKAKWKDLAKTLAKELGIEKNLEPVVLNGVQDAFLKDTSFRDITVENPEIQSKRTDPKKAEEWDRRKTNGVWTRDECMYVLRIMKRVFGTHNLLPIA